MTKRFQDKVVWITGASSGIGLEMAKQFAAEGASVCITGRRGDRLEQLSREVEAAGGRALAIPCDVTDEESMTAAVESIIQSFGKLDIAVANAGFAASGRVERLTTVEWRRQLEVNVIAAALTARLSIPHLRETQGRLVLIASVAGMVPMPYTGAYGASKAALISMGRTLSVELHGTGMSCTTICPGFVESEITGVNNEGVFTPEKVRRNPLEWTTVRAVRVMLKAIERRRRFFVFTGHGRVTAFVGRHFPALIHFVMTRPSAMRATRKRDRSPRHS